jgi:methyl-accepting chemotaxis protein
MPGGGAGPLDARFGNAGRRAGNRWKAGAAVGGCGEPGLTNKFNSQLRKIQMLTNLKIGVRLALAFGIVLALLATLSIIALARTSAMRDDMNAVTAGIGVESSLADQMRLAATQQAVRVRNILMLDDPDDMAAENKLLKTDSQSYDAAKGKLAKMIAAENDARKKTILGHIDATEKEARDLAGQVVQMALDSHKFPARGLLGDKANPAQAKWMAAVDEMVALNEKLTATAVSNAEDAYGTTRNTVLGISIVALVFASFIGLAVTRSITRPISQAVEIARRVANRDLSVKVVSHSTDETGQLLKALAAMTESLVSVVSSVRNGSDSLASAASQIASGNADLSNRTERQASSIQQTASSMDELSSTVKMSASNSTHARQLSNDAAAKAQEGGEAVSKVVRTMGDIATSSKKISDIISVIDGIAFQTNILALNAAVEAARAGEQGRGFAVVATEVRTLAQRSATAAKEIESLISESVEKVDEGTHLVDVAAGTIAQIVQSVQHVAGIVSEITSATVEQSAGIDLVNVAVTEMDQVTQQNAALVEEVAAAADSMSTQVQRLVSDVSVFRL